MMNFVNISVTFRVYMTKRYHYLSAMFVLNWIDSTAIVNVECAKSIGGTF